MARDGGLGAQPGHVVDAANLCFGNTLGVISITAGRVAEGYIQKDEATEGSRSLAAGTFGSVRGWSVRFRNSLETCSSRSTRGRQGNAGRPAKSTNWRLPSVHRGHFPRTRKRRRLRPEPRHKASLGVHATWRLGAGF